MDSYVHAVDVKQKLTLIFHSLQVRKVLRHIPGSKLGTAGQKDKKKSEKHVVDRLDGVRM